MASAQTTLKILRWSENIAVEENSKYSVRILKVSIYSRVFSWTKLKLFNARVTFEANEGKATLMV